MKVKIGDVIYDSDEEPIMLILDEYNKQDIADMIDEDYKVYCVYPDDMEEEEIEYFMSENIIVDEGFMEPDDES